MDANLQLISFLASFLYGWFIYGVLVWFRWFRQGKIKFWKILLSSFLALDLALLYILILYRINEGLLHIYFLLTCLSGVIVAAKVNVLSKLRKTMKKN